MDATATAPAPQHMRALAQANRVRLARAELKRQVADGELDVAHVVRDGPWVAESMSIADLLMSQHRWGRTRCRRFLASIPMLETKTVGSMTERQRNALAAQLHGEPVAERFHFVGT
jgi:glutathione S-transferase